jgi:hypothetical protein
LALLPLSFLASSFCVWPSKSRPNITTIITIHIPTTITTIIIGHTTTIIIITIPPTTTHIITITITITTTTTEGQLIVKFKFIPLRDLAYFTVRINWH